MDKQLLRFDFFVDKNRHFQICNELKKSPFLHSWDQHVKFSLSPTCPMNNKQSANSTILNMHMH